MSLSYTLMSLIYETIKTSRDPEHTPFWVVIYHACANSSI